MNSSVPQLAQLRLVRTQQVSLRWLLFLTISSCTMLALLPLIRAGAAKQSTQSQQGERARLSETITVQAAGLGNPSLNLTDGHNLLVDFAGEPKLQQLLVGNQAQALSLCAADFDEDGVPDLISGYSGGGQGILTLYRGNVDALYPNGPEAQQRRANGTFSEAPFLSPAQVFSLPGTPDFTGAGDFDGDSHLDVVVASRGGKVLYLLSGDGRGGLRPAKAIELGGTVTALNTGEINRRDGLTDVVVGIESSRGPAVLVYEGPEGALRAEPESFSLPASATSLALGRFGDEGYFSLAVAAGNDLLIVHGRDRKLSLAEDSQKEVPAAQIEKLSFPAAINSIAIGDFGGNEYQKLAVALADSGIRILSEETGEWKTRSELSYPQIAAASLLGGHVSNNPGDDLLVMDSVSHQMQVFSVQSFAQQNTHSLPTPAAVPSLATTPGEYSSSKRSNEVVRVPQRASSSSPLELTKLASFEVQGEPVAAMPMRLNEHAPNSLVTLNTANSAPAIMLATAAAIITVNSEADTNARDSVLTLREAILVATGNLALSTLTTGEKAQVSGTPAGGALDEVRFNIPGSGAHTINVGSTGLGGLPGCSDPITIDGTFQPGFLGSPLIELNGSGAGSNGGLTVFGGNSTVRGLVINRFALDGILLFSGNNNLIAGNYIGTNVAGSAALGNLRLGIFADSTSSNTIGGTASGARNVFSGNVNSFGIQWQGGSLNTFQGNYFGLNAAGTSAVSNAQGIYILSDNNRVGGTEAGARNVFSGHPNGVGVTIVNGGTSAVGNVIQGNYIGTNFNGTVSVDNHLGMFVSDGSKNQIGGTVAAARNLFSGNNSYGIQIQGINSFLNQIQGNYVGTEVTGVNALGNHGGIYIISENTHYVGGTVPSARNILSGNFDDALTIALSVSGNQVRGNYIGLNVNGNALGNTRTGVWIFNADNNIIGGTTIGTANVISNCGASGVAIYGGDSNFGPARNARFNQIQGNFIGTDATGTRAMGNAGDGVQVTQATDNSIGGSTFGARNIISSNLGNGVSIGVHLIYQGSMLPGSGGRGLTIQNNYIGTDVNGTAPLGNRLSGIYIDADSLLNTIKDNLIAFNGNNGVSIPQNSNPGVQITITSNQIFGNSSTAIDLGFPGDTANDDLDTDGGANTQQNYPELQTATKSSITNRVNGADSTAITFNYRMRSSRNSTFTVEFFASSGNCFNKQFTDSQGERIGSEAVTTDGSGLVNRSITLPLTGNVRNPQWLLASATATSVPGGTIGASIGNTSEMSQCLAVNAATTTHHKKTAGVFRPSNGIVYLRNSNTGGVADVSLVYGNAGDQPIAGDWNGDGIDTLGIYRNGVFYLRNSNSTGAADIVFPFGASGDQPVAGDWNGDGIDTIGVYRPTTGVFFLRNSNTPGEADLSFVLGNPGDVAIAGDWNGDGVTTCGVFRPTNGIIYLKNTNVTGNADINLVYGNAGDKPVAGDWDGDGIDSIGIYRNGLFYLRNSNTQGFADLVFALGNDGDVPIAGDWDGLP